MIIEKCWMCEFIVLGGTYFPCGCGYFKLIGKEIKDIPQNVLIEGCSFFKPKQYETNTERRDNYAEQELF